MGILDTSKRMTDDQNTNNSGDDNRKAHFVVLVDNEGNEVEYKIKSDTKFGRIIKSYAERFKKDPTQLRMSWDGRVINKEDTPERLSMGEKVNLEMMVPQVGG